MFDGTRLEMQIFWADQYYHANLKKDYLEYLIRFKNKDKYRVTKKKFE